MKSRYNILLAACILCILVLAGCKGSTGSAGTAGPTMPVIQSMAISGVPAARTGTITIKVSAQSAEGLALTYAWSVTTGWSIASGSATDTVTIAAPNMILANGYATVTVTDTQSRSAVGTAALSTHDGSWGTASLIEIDNAGSALGPQIAFDQNGNAIAVWYQSDGTRDNIWSNRYVVGAGWGTAEIIETDNAGNAYNPRIAVDPNGNAIAVWQQSDGTRNNIWANRYVVGTGWGTAALIETDNAGSASSPQIAFDRNGNAIAVWYQSNGTRDNIWANRYVVSTGWGTAGLIETDNTGDAYNPQVAFDQDGNAIAVWYQSDGRRFNILANRYVAGTGWGSAELIEIDNAGSAFNPQIVIDRNGNAMAVWYQSEGTRNNIWANRYVAGTGWGTAGLIETNNAGSASSPQIAFDPNGNAIAVWYRSDGTWDNIWANRYVAGTGWGVAGLIETDHTGSAFSPQIAIDWNGNAIAVWYQSDGTRNNIRANRYVAGTGWGLAGLIETDNAGSAYNPQIAFDQNGSAIAVWYQSDGARNNIWANRFE